MIDNAMIWTVVLMVVGFLVAQQFKPTAPPLQGEKITAKVRHVVDGDSLYLKGYKPQIRLWGVDAPEKQKSGFNAATEQLKRLSLGEKVTCQVIDKDRYGRTVARCFLSDGQEINAAMIASGTATEYKRFTKGFYAND